MKQIFKQLVLVIFIGLSTSSGLMAQFIISGEFRPRFEYRDGYLKLRDSSQTPYFVIPGRNRLTFDFKNEQFMAKFTLQHAYVFGENNYSSDTITRNTLNIYEGWFRYSFVKGFAIKIGRMELVYDDGRLLGNSNWNPKAASHDAALLQWEASQMGYRGDFGFAINNTAPAGAFLASYPLKNYKYMAYLYEQKKFFKDKLTLSLLALLDVMQKPGTTTKTKSTTYDTLYVTNSSHDTIGTTVIPVTTTNSVSTSYPTQLYGRFTIGGNIGYSWKKLKLLLSGYYQTGHYNNGRKINAGFFTANASYQLFKPLNLLIGYDYLSGNNYADTLSMKSKTGSFSTLYSTNHGFYGYMDLFSSSVSTGNTAGLTDLYFKATLTLHEKVYIEATYRIFGLAQGALPATVKKAGDLPYVEVNKSLGSELDLMAVYRPHKSIEFNAAYCFFMPTSTMETLNGLKSGTSKFAQYAYLMITYKPTFFNSEKH